MRRAIPIVVCLVWGLWFGGLIGVFIAVTTLFHIYAEKLLAATGAAGIFHAFEKYQLILAGIGLTATVIWRMLPWGKPSAPGLKTAFFVLLALSTIAAACSKLYITPQIDEMRDARTTSGPEFSRLHGASMLLYCTEAGLLLVAGLLLPTALAFANDTVVEERIGR